VPRARVLFADRGYFNSPEILACEQADITVTLPRPMTSTAKSYCRFGEQDFVYLRWKMSIAVQRVRSRFHTRMLPERRNPVSPGTHREELISFWRR
jgi:hypothetical protein